MPSASTTTQLRVSRPTLRVGGQESEALAQGLLELAIVEEIQGLYHCEAKFGNLGPTSGGGGGGGSGNASGFLYFDRRTLDFGTQFAVKLGTDVVFDGVISALEARFPDGGAPPEFVVLAEDKLLPLRMTRRTMTWTNVSDSDVFQRIAGAHGLSPDLGVSGPTHKVLAQVNLSDLAFARERARSIDAELWVSGSTLSVKPRSARGRDTVTLGLGNELRELTVTADLAGQRSGVTVSGWDVSSKQAIKEQASDSALSSELGSDTSGASLLASARLGQRQESLVHTVPLSSDEARVRAESHFKAGARRFVRARGVAQTDPKLRVGAKVDLQGIGSLFEGKYYVTEVRHLFDNAKGLRTEFVGERPGIGQAR